MGDVFMKRSIKSKPSLLMAIIIFIILGSTFFYLEISRHQSLILQANRSEIERLFYRFESFIEDQMKHLKMLAQVWSGQHFDDPEAQFLIIAEEIVDIFPFYRFIHYLDVDLFIRSSAPREEALKIGIIGKDTKEDPLNTILLEEIKRTQSPLISPARWRAISAAYGAHIWAPIMRSNQLLGIISGDLDLNHMIHDKLIKRGLVDLPLVIKIDGQEIYRAGDQESYPALMTQEIMGIPWTIGIDVDYAMSLSFVFVFSLLLSLFVSILVYHMFLKNRYLKETKDELEVSEKRYRAIFNLSPVGIMIEDDQGHILEVNKAMCSISDYKREELEGESIFGTLVETNKENIAIAKNNIAKLLSGGDLIFETKSKTGRGNEQYKQLYETRIPLPDGSNGILSMHVDITERKQAEESLRQQEKKTKEAHQVLLTVLESVDIIIYVFDMETYEVLFINRYGKTVWGDCTGQKCWETLKEGQRGPCENCTNEKLLDAHGQPAGVYLREVYNTKYRRWYDYHDAAIQWIDGRIVRMKIALDITNRKQAEARLAQRTQELERLYQKQNQEMIKARTIHERMLPKSLPMLKNISINGYYQPTDLMGGDFYDVILVEDKLVLYLSDVSGHGLDGSMLSVFVKQTIKGFLSFSPAHAVTPWRILDYLTDQFSQENYPEEYFICIFLVVLDLESMEMTYSGAGFQDTPLVKQGNGEQVELTAKGLFISNVFSKDMMNFQEKQITLAPGSTILFNTDGLTEQGEPGAYYRERLSKVFYEHAYLPPDFISQVIVRDFYQFNNSSLQSNDDISFLVMQVEPENQKKRNLELSTDFGELKNLRNNVKELLPELETIDTITSCLYELVANAMEHGNRMDPQKRVFLEFTELHDGVQVSVEDEGEGFHWLPIIDKPLELEGHSERGRGLAMTKIVSDGLFYNRKGNKVICVIKTS